MTEQPFERQKRASRIRALETLCGDMPDVDKHFLADRLLSYGSAGGGVTPLTNEDFVPVRMEFSR